jgi:hypothetical protein
MPIDFKFTGEYDGYLFTKRIDVNEDISRIIQNILYYFKGGKKNLNK